MNTENRRALMPCPHCYKPVLPQERPESRAWQCVEGSIGDSVLGLAGSFLCASVQINQGKEIVQPHRSLSTVSG